MKKVVLVTGSSRGIGKEIINLFIKNGYRVVINYNKTDIKKIDYSDDIKNSSDALFIKADVTCDNDVISMFEQVFEKFGKIDVLINNAGIVNDTLFLEKNKDDFMHVLDVNLYGTYNVSRCAHKYLSNDANIINISSNNGIDQGYPESCDYDVSKAGVISLTHNMAKVYAPIRVNCICPGWVNTDMNKNLDKDQIRNETNRILLNRFADPIEIANVCLFIASDKASYINDTIIRVDGGIK